MRSICPQGRTHDLTDGIKWVILLERSIALVDGQSKLSMHAADKTLTLELLSCSIQRVFIEI